MATRAWGTVPYSSIGLIPNVPTLEHVIRGVRLFSNGLSLSGRCSVRVNLGTSDPQEPQKACELQCRLLSILIPFQ